MIRQDLIIYWLFEKGAALKDTRGDKKKKGDRRKNERRQKGNWRFVIDIYKRSNEEDAELTCK